ncbi:MAG: hypothetical protein K9G60_13885 [Pseudolabrys sp.]|nr:hypothetical protein [Pseudolabrys sp.]
MTPYRAHRPVSRPLFVRAAVLAAMAGLVLLAAPAAQAFTFQDKDQDAGTQNGWSSDRKQLDGHDLGLSDRSASRFDDGKQTVIKRGNSTIFFNGPTQSFDQRNNPNDYFSPNYLMGR